MSVIRSIRNIFGGKTYYQDGEVIARSVDNIFGGETIYGKGGEVIGRTVENIIPGETIYLKDEKDYVVQPSVEKSSICDIDFKEEFGIDVGGDVDFKRDFGIDI